MVRGSVVIELGGWSAFSRVVKKRGKIEPNQNRSAGREIFTLLARKIQRKGLQNRPSGAPYRNQVALRIEHGGL